MNSLKEYILEKFKITKDISIKSDADILADYLTGGNELDKKTKNDIFDLYNSDCNGVVPKFILKEIKTTAFKLLFTVASILHVNSFTSPNGIKTIKTFSSMDEVDMFNFDCLTKEIKDEMCIDYLIDLYNTDKKFKETFTKIFNIEYKKLGCDPEVFNTDDDLLELAKNTENE